MHFWAIRIFRAAKLLYFSFTLLLHQVSCLSIIYDFLFGLEQSLHGHTIILLIKLLNEELAAHLSILVVSIRIYYLGEHVYCEAYGPEKRQLEVQGKRQNTHIQNQVEVGREYVKNFPHSPYPIHHVWKLILHIHGLLMVQYLFLCKGCATGFPIIIDHLRLQILVIACWI